MMASDESSHTQSINPPPTDASSIIEHMQSDTSIPPSSTIILITPNSSHPTPSKQPSKNSSIASDLSKFPYIPTRKKKPVKGISMVYLKHRLCVRARFVARL
jgi:hypothetical protein